MENADLQSFDNGVPVGRLSDGGMIQGQFGGEDVILVRRGDQFFALGAHCTHYGGPLVKGLLLGDEVRCPLHHACFDLRTGEALRCPAFDAIPCWRTERIGETVFVREKLSAPTRKQVSTKSPNPPTSVVIVGGGGAGLAAADTLRREGFDGPVTMISTDDYAPYDRPNLSKEYLAGNAPDEWMPLRTSEYYADRRINLVLKSRVTSLDIQQKRVQVENGGTYEYGALLLATGTEPIRLPIEGASHEQVFYLRTFADGLALAEKAKSAKQVVVVGGSFIALEVAAALRERGIGVHVVARGHQPLERVLGSEIGRFVRGLHESHGVVFHLGESVVQVEGHKAILKGGTALDMDFLVLGVGVQPSLALAQQAGLKIDRGIVVDHFLETSAPGIFAAGDIARWPDARTGELIRVEHWVVAERQGQVAARNILGRRERFNAVPFFWTRQFEVSIKYVGHAEKWDAVEIDGRLEAGDCAVAFQLGGKTLAVATIGRDLQNLRNEALMESQALSAASSRVFDSESH